MPKFVRTVAVLTVLMWGVLAFIVFYIPSDTYLNILSFLAILYIALHGTLSIPFYLIYKKRLPNFTDQRLLYRMGTKWSAFLSFIVIGILFLKAFHLINLLNAGLFALLCIGILFQVKGRK